MLDYLRARNLTNAGIENKARGLVERGYQRLLTFECINARKLMQREGYEWFGGMAPPHEALTAYGLMLFRDMMRVTDRVDKDMLARTHRYLLSRKDGKGGFLRDKNFHSFGAAPDAIFNAYIVWALTENNTDDDLETEIASLVTQAQNSGDPYFLALVANCLLNRSKGDAARPILQKLASAQKPDGFLDGATTSITLSHGRDLLIETTALAVIAWLKAEPPTRALTYRTAIQTAASWLGKQRGAYGGFGATQATILTLKALVALDRSAKALQAGEVALYVGDKAVAFHRYPPAASEVQTINLADADKYFRTGKNKVRLEMAGENELPFTLSWTYRTVKPPSADNCRVRLKTHLDRTTAQEGETVRLKATVENRMAETLGMTVAIIGLPAGLTLPEDMKQLKELARLRNNDTEPGIISSWETRGRELILYWRTMAADQKIDINLDLICRVPGEYRGPASRAYVYYNADEKHWVDPLQIAIQPVQKP